MADVRSYRGGPIEPVVQIGENLAIYSQGQWGYWRAAYLEPLPRSRQLTHDFGAIAANASVAKLPPPELRLDDKQFLQLRFEPVDHLEVVLWETAGQAKFVIKQATARVTLATKIADPFLATSEFYILGRDRDPNIEVFNNTAYARTVSRVVFWGFRYILDSLAGKPDYFTQVVAEGRSG